MSNKYRNMLKTKAYDYLCVIIKEIMSDRSEQELIRREKLTQLRALGIEPYPVSKHTLFCFINDDNNKECASFELTVW